MNKYLLNSKESEYYILSYEVKNNVITVYLANQTLYELEYTKRNEEVIISRMEKQARTLKKKNKSIFQMLRYSLEIVIAILAISSLGANVLIALGIVYGVVAALNLFLYTKAIDKHNEEVEKFEYFLDNQEGLNFVAENEEKIKELVKEKTLEKIEKELKNSRKPFTINSIDNYSLKELKYLKEDVQKYYLNKKNNTVEKPFVLAKKYKQKQG